MRTKQLKQGMAAKVGLFRKELRDSHRGWSVDPLPILPCLWQIHSSLCQF